MGKRSPSSRKNPGSNVGARPAASPPAGAASRYRRLVFLLLAGGVLLAAGSAGLYWLHQRGPEPPAIRSEEVEREVVAAIENARAAVRQSPRSGETWGRLGMVLLAHRFLTEARICFARAEELDPGEPRWPYHQGAVQSATDPEGAIPRLRRAVQLGRDRFQAPRLRLADLLLSQAHDVEAQTQFETILQAEPGNSLAQLGLARLAYARGELPESHARLQKAAASPLTRKAAHALLASAYERLGNDKAAEQERRTSEALPEDTPALDPFAEAVAELAVDKRSRLQRATAWLKQRRFQEGVAALQELIASYPEWSLPWQALGQAFLERRDYLNAESYLQKAVALAPDSVDGEYYLGCAESRLGKNAEALGCFRKAIELKPDHGIAHYNMGYCLKLQGDRASAIAAFRAAVKCRPYMAEAHHSLGELLAESGARAEAIVHLQAALELNPKDERAHKLLERVRATAPVKTP